MTSIATTGTVWFSSPGQFDIFTDNGAWSLFKVMVIQILGGIFLMLQRSPVPDDWDGEERRNDEKKLNEAKPESEFNPLGLDDIRGRD